MPFTVKFPLSLRDGDSSDSVPVPNAPVTVGGNSWSPDMAAKKVTVVWVGAAVSVGVVSVSPPQAANVNAKIPATHHLDGTTNFESSKMINLFSRVLKNLPSCRQNYNTRYLARLARLDADSPQI